VVKVDLEDVRTILEAHEGQTLYPMMISNIMVELRNKSREKVDNNKNPFI
jgi:hypothetical protein